MSGGVSVLLADIGGTRARFALAEDGAVGPVETYEVAAYRNPAAAIEAFLASRGEAAPPVRAALAVAAPIAGEGDEAAARLTNGDWAFDAADLRRTFGLGQVVLVNDFAAVSHAIPALGSDDWMAVGGGSPQPGATVAVLGAGTGLGVGGLVDPAGRPKAITGEGGHVTLAASNDREAALLAGLRERYEHVSAERVLSGEGLSILYRTIGGGDASPQEITARALAGSDPDSTATLDTFCEFLGTVASDLAVTLGARGGVYIAGGILPRVRNYFAASGFRARFEAKGRFRDYLAAIPTRLIVRPDPAFAGLAALDRLTHEDRS